MFKSPKAPKIAAPKMSAPRVPQITSEHIAKQFQAVHPDNTATGALTDMFEVQRHTDVLTKGFAGKL